MNAFFSFDLFMVYIPECKQQLRTVTYNTHRYEILHTLNLGCTVLLFSESRAINDLDVILYRFMLQIIYTPVARDCLRNKSWKPQCVGSFNMDWRILVFYSEPEARDKIY